MIPHAATAQQKPKKEPNYDLKKCALKSLSKKVAYGGKPSSIRIRKGEKSTGYSPIVAFEILESGEVSNVRLKRSSGIADIDDNALAWIRSMKYNSRPGCGVIDSETGVTIDWGGL